MNRRQSFTPAIRQAIYAKTDGHCHICGKKSKRWAADHIKPHVAGGQHKAENYLPACPACNRLRWFYTPAQLKRILELGVYLQKEMDRGTELGKRVKDFYHKRQRVNIRRKRVVK